MLEITGWRLKNQILFIELKGRKDPNAVQLPRISVRFCTDGEDRILPLPIQHCSDHEFTALYSYELWNLFQNIRWLTAVSITFLDHMTPVDIRFPISVVECPEWMAELQGKTIYLRAVKAQRLHPALRNIGGFFRANRKEQMKRICEGLIHLVYTPYRLLRVRPNRVSFCSNRREALSGNPAFVYEKLAAYKNLDLQVLLNDSNFSFHALFRFFHLYATSRVLVVDDYYLYLSYVPRRKATKIVQLWHACGAFKTFGFSRLGKDTSLLQSSRNHRQYDAAIVSSAGGVPCYAEGFGIPSDHVYPLGVPRTDVFFDSSYREQVRNRFFAAHPAFADKRIILFAPTFRGGGKGSAFYPIERFPINRLLAALGMDTVLLIKMHPYLHQRFSVDPAFADHVLDCSDAAELNDLLFVTDVLITDYSSVVYEAALLKIPMLFYAFDLEEYMASRDFYSDFLSWIPGRLVRTPEELITALCEQDYEAEKLERFRAENLENTEGQASERTAKLIYSLVRETLQKGESMD